VAVTGHHSHPSSTPTFFNLVSVDTIVADIVEICNQITWQEVLGDEGFAAVVEACKMGIACHLNEEVIGMAIYLDSAFPDDVRQAVQLGFVAGVTTNPRLLARVGRPAEQLVPELCDIVGDGLVFYQLTAVTVEERKREAHHIAGLRPGQIGLKIPCTTENLGLLPDLARNGLICAVTAVFSAYQALLACEVGADYLVLYVNRATRQLGDGIALVEEIADVIEVTGASTEILAASFHNLTEVVEATWVGADHVAISLDLLRGLGDHPLSERAMEEFARFV
jgi:transaldolase